MSSVSNGRDAVDNHAVNVIRASAALLVAAGHVRTLFFLDYKDVTHNPITALTYTLLSLGHAAVIVFFVLSGFWVGGSVIRQIQQNRFSWSDYLIRRLTRLWLVLLPALALTAAIDHLGRALYGGGAVYQGAERYHNVVTASHNLGLVTALGNIAFLQSIHVPNFGTDSPLWSLAYEFWFYAWFPMLLLVATSRRRGLRVVTLCVFLASLALAGLHVFAYFPLWLLGAVVAWRSKEIERFVSRLRRRIHLGAVALASGATLLAMAVDKALNMSDVTGAPLIAAATALLLALLIADIDLRNRVSRRALRATSQYAHVSYSLYAIHLPLVAFAAAALMHGRRWSPNLVHMGGLLCVLASVCVVAWLFGQVTEARTQEVRLLFGRLVHRRTVVTVIRRWPFTSWSLGRK